MNIFTIDTYPDNINGKEIDYLIKLKYSGEKNIDIFNENDPIFNNKYFCSNVSWYNILRYHRNKLSFDFIRKHKKHIFPSFYSMFHHFTEEFLDEMWDEFEDNENLIITLINIKNLSIEFIERRFEDIIKKNDFFNHFCSNDLWSTIYEHLKDKNIEQIKNPILKKIINDYSKNNKPLRFSDYLELINSN